MYKKLRLQSKAFVPPCSVFFGEGLKEDHYFPLSVFCPSEHLGILFIGVNSLLYVRCAIPNGGKLNVFPLEILFCISPKENAFYFATTTLFLSEA